MFADRILVPRNIVPPLPQRAIEYMRHDEASIYFLFFYMFTYVESGDDVFSTLESTFHEIELESPPGGDYDYSTALSELFTAFESFYANAERPLACLRSVPPGIVIADITVLSHDNHTLLLQLEFEEVPVNEERTYASKRIYGWDSVADGARTNPPHSSII